MLRRLTALATPGARHALSVAARPRLTPTGAALVGSTVAAVSASCIAEPTEKSNPLLAQPSLFPRYADIRAEHVQPALDARLDAAEAALVRLEAAITAKLEAGGTPTYSELNDEAERIEELVGGPWSAVNHLKSVKDEEALRKAVELTQPRVVRFSTRMSQSAPLYRGWSALRADATAWAALSETQRRVAEIAIRDAKLAGIGLEGAAKARFNEIAEERAQLSTTLALTLARTRTLTLTLTPTLTRSSRSCRPASATTCSTRPRPSRSRSPTRRRWRRGLRTLPLPLTPTPTLTLPLTLPRWRGCLRARSHRWPPPRAARGRPRPPPPTGRG